MRLVSIHNKTASGELGIICNNRIFSTALGQISGLPISMKEMLNGNQSVWDLMRTFEIQINEGKVKSEGLPYDNKWLMAPVPEPTSCRDGYAFRQHVSTARRNRGVEMIPEFDQYPIFYFTNHNSVQGPGDIFCMPDHFDKLDFELEACVVIGKKGRNVRAEKADEFIAGYMIMNDMSARTLQMEEMMLNLGPAKGKDFSTAIGPVLVTPDELNQYQKATKTNHQGNQYNLEMTCRINGVEVSRGNMGDMDWTFAEIIERCAYGVDLFPGDVIGSGTVGTGCFLELNGTGKLNDPAYQAQWLQPNDTIEMEITGLGKLTNTVRSVDSDYSILALKKGTRI